MYIKFSHLAQGPDVGHAKLVSLSPDWLEESHCLLPVTLRLPCNIPNLYVLIKAKVSIHLLSIRPYKPKKQTNKSNLL
jgi:hypothetical protein